MAELLKFNSLVDALKYLEKASLDPCYHTSSVGSDVIDILEKHFSAYSYVSGYQPYWRHELLVLELLARLFGSTSVPASHRLSKMECWSQVLEQLLSDDLSSLRLALETELELPLSSLEQYPCLQRWYKHVTSLHHSESDAGPESVAEALFKAIDASLQVNNLLCRGHPMHHCFVSISVNTKHAIKKKLLHLP